MEHPDKIRNFQVYMGSKLLGIVDATLPNLTPLKETTKGAGIAGEIETPAPGQFGTLKLQLTWRQPTREAVMLANPDGQTVELRASAQVADSATYRLKGVPVKIVLKGVASDMQLGKFDPGTAMGTTTELECLYYKMEWNGQLLYEVDKLNFKCLINGVDVLAVDRANMGE